MSYGTLSILGYSLPSSATPRGVTIPAKPGGGVISIPGFPGLDVASAAGPLVDAMMPLIEAKMPGVVAAASPAIQAEVSKALPGVVDGVRTQVLLAMVAQTAIILGVGWYFLKGPGARGGF